MKNRKTSPGRRLRTIYRRCDVEGLKWLPSSAFRQIGHAGVLGTVFPQDAEFAMSDLPEADVAGPMVRKGSVFHVLRSLAGSLPR